MVVGIEKFKEKFQSYPNCYTIIGGAACEILMDEAQHDFRATKDIDMIIVFEDLYKEFAKVFWEYIKEAGYKCGWKNSDKLHFYRFTNPKPGYPAMIELFSRKPDYHLAVDSTIVPIHIDENTSSLSGILLNDDYYNFMLKGRKIIRGLSVLSAEYLIPFKMYAYLDLRDKKEKGEFVKSTDIKKHRNDVFRLLQIVTLDKTIELNGLVYTKTLEFIETIVKEEIPLESIGVSLTKEESLNILQNLYEI